jgi:hypothetical protein
MRTLSNLVNVKTWIPCAFLEAELNLHAFSLGTDMSAYRQPACVQAHCKGMAKLVSQNVTFNVGVSRGSCPSEINAHFSCLALVDTGLDACE